MERKKRFESALVFFLLCSENFVRYKQFLMRELLELLHRERDVWWIYLYIHFCCINVGKGGGGYCGGNTCGRTWREGWNDLVSIKLFAFGILIINFISLMRIFRLSEATSNQMNIGLNNVVSSSKKKQKKYCQI